MDSNGWEQALDQARDERDIIALVREFVASLDYHEISAMPPDLRPGKFFVADDVAGYALKLARNVADDPAHTLAVAHRFVAFFVHAHLRLSQVLARTNDALGGAENIA
ncbi:MAG TPA: hypothetical protein VFO24_09655 [Usitatibacter sp.]|nr:hypothetical protein [Usitatibacter sp.]